MSRLSDVMLNATLDQNDAAVQVARVALAAVGDPENQLADKAHLEAVQAMLDGDFGTAKILLRDVVNATVGFARAATR